MIRIQIGKNCRDLETRRKTKQKFLNDNYFSDQRQDNYPQRGCGGGGGRGGHGGYNDGHDDYNQSYNNEYERGGYRGRGGDKDGRGGRGRYQDGGMFEMSVPGYKVGLIVGKGGETIKQLKERSGAKIIIIQDGPEAAHEKSLRISGDPNAVETAKELIQELLNQKDDSNMQQQGRMFEMSVPGYKIGLIIGKGGETIKQLKERSGAQIIIFQDGPEAAHEKLLRITGDPNAVETAKELVQEILNKKDDRDPQQQQGGGVRGGLGGYNDGYDDHDNSYGYHEPQAPPPVQHMVCFNL